MSQSVRITSLIRVKSLVKRGWNTKLERVSLGASVTKPWIPKLKFKREFNSQSESVHV